METEGHWLWFAFVLWIIFDWYQPIAPAVICSISCDLLSFFELSLIDTNYTKPDMLSFAVVICFRSLNYLWLIPTATNTHRVASVLWFAFVLWIIFDWYQPPQPMERVALRCDLLSFFELSLIDTNQRWKWWKAHLVVICFRSLNYLWLIPTHWLYGNPSLLLWFAFVLWIIFDWYQRNTWHDKHHQSCDLLSFFELSLIDTNCL